MSNNYWIPNQFAPKLHDGLTCLLPGVDFWDGDKGGLLSVSLQTGGSSFNLRQLTLTLEATVTDV